jgi:MFS family permease
MHMLPPPPGNLLSPLADMLQIHFSMLVATYAVVVITRGAMTAVTSFAATMALALLMECAASPMGVIVDATVVAVSDKEGSYGRARLWASIGWGGMSAVAGVVVGRWGLQASFKIFAVLYSLGGIPTFFMPAYILKGAGVDPSVRCHRTTTELRETAGLPTTLVGLAALGGRAPAPGSGAPQYASSSDEIRSEDTKDWTLQKQMAMGVVTSEEKDFSAGVTAVNVSALASPAIAAVHRQSRLSENQAEATLQWHVAVVATSAVQEQQQQQQQQQQQSGEWAIPAANELAEELELGNGTGHPIEALAFAPLETSVRQPRAQPVAESPLMNAAQQRSDHAAAHAPMLVAQENTPTAPSIPAKFSLPRHASSADAERGVVVAASESVPPPQPSSGQWSELRQLLRGPSTVSFFFLAFIMGFGNGVMGLTFIFMQQLGASGTLMGLTLTVNCAAEVPVFFFSGSILRRATHLTLINLAMAAYVVRLTCYALMPLYPTLWLVLPVELLHGATFALAWTVGVAFCKMMAPKPLVSTVQSVFAGLYSGVGAGVGALAGGQVYGAYGGEAMFYSAAGVVMVGWAASNCVQVIDALRRAGTGAGRAAAVGRRGLARLSPWPKGPKGRLSDHHHASK